MAGGVMWSLLLITCLAVVQGEYMVLYPSTAQAGLGLTAVVSLTNNDPASATVTVKIVKPADKTVVAEGQILVNNDESKSLVIAIPASAAPGTYNVEADDGSGSKPLKYSQQRTIEIKSKGVSMFIQTDKTKYKPGQKIQFRVVAVNGDLKPVVGEMDIFIYDAKNNKIKQWLKVKNPNGVASQSLELSDEPVMGKWKIKAKISEGGVEESKEFDVEKYVPPKFEVTVSTKPYHLCGTGENIIVTTNAKYTFGKPVVGRVVLSVRKEYGNEKYTISSEKFDGKLISVIDMKKVQAYLGSNLNNNKLFIKAQATEDVTGNTLEGETETKCEAYDAKIEFMKSSDDYFKPGLKYRADVQVTQPDGSPLSALEERRTHTVKLMVSVRGKWNQETRKSNNVEFETDTQTVPPNGIIRFEFDMPEDAQSATLNAIYSLPMIKGHKSITPFTTNMAQSIQIMPPLGQEKLQIGQNAAFNLLCTNLVNSYTVSVKSRGKVVHSARYSVPATDKPSQTSQFTIPVSTSMAPNSNIIVTTLVKNATDYVEMLADSYPFELDKLFANEMSLSFSKESTEIATDITLSVEAAPESDVFMLGVDKSVRLMGTGNDITADEVQKEMATYDMGPDVDGGGGCRFGACPMARRKKRSIAPWWFWQSSATSADVIQNAGMNFLTNAKFAETQDTVWLEDAVPVARPGADGGVLEKTADSSSQQQPYQEALQVRKDFPETWIWTEVTAGADGKASITVKVPDTITSWVATGFAISENAGLGLPPNEATLRAFKPFFMNLNMPYSVIAKEEFVLQVIVFNYLGQDTRVRVTLAESPDFKVRHGEKLSEATPEQKEVEEAVLVESDQAVAVKFWIVTEKIGTIEFDITANAGGGLAGDRMKKVMIVEPPGKRIERNVAMFVNPKGQEEKFDIDLDFPAVFVPGSERVEVEVVGDILGPALQNLDKLLKMPYGCGEQNMINFAPAIYVHQYLEATGQMNAELLTKILKILNTGYQRELNYRHDDGSFSAFGNGDSSGSTWLTAFVMKSFAAAHGRITVDETQIADMKTWLMKQNKEGQFGEPGRVLHTDMQGGSASGVTMTAYVVIALLEGRTDGELAAAKDALTASIALLERTVQDSSSDAYTKCICIYALKLAGSPKADQALDAMKQEAAKDPTPPGYEDLKKILIDGVCLSKKMDDSGVYRYSQPAEPKSSVVEMGAYLLLTMTVNKNIQGGSSVAKCLMGMRNKYGGFASTQDTVLAMQALSGYAELISGGTRAMTINVQADNYQQTININEKNAGVLQSFELPPSTRSLQLIVNGEGPALIQVPYKYNIESEDNDVPLQLTTTTKSIDKRTFEITACTTWTDPNQKSGMVLLKFNTPSGYTAVENSASGANLKRQEVDDGAMNVYLDDFTAEEKCVKMQAEQVNSVTNLQPVPVQARLYYQPEKQRSNFYSASQLQVGLSECELCDTCRGCPKYISSAHSVYSQSRLTLGMTLLLLFIVRQIRG